MSRNGADAGGRRFDREAFCDWAHRQKDLSRSPTARVIVDEPDEVRLRLREGEREGNRSEDIVFKRDRDVDVIRFECGGDQRQFLSHRRAVTFHAKRLIVRTDEGEAICRAGTGTRKRRGPFPV